MKTLLLLLVAGCLTSPAVYSQSVQEQVTTINKTRLETDKNISTYRKVEGFKLGAGSKCVFKDGNELKLVTIEMKDKNLEMKVQWYFSKGELIYATQVSTDVRTGRLVNNDKTYVNNSQAFVWIKTGDVSVDNSSKEFKAMNTELIAYADKLEKDSVK